MDGKDASRRLRELLSEEDTGTWIDLRTSYDFLWEAAKTFVGRTNCLTSYQDITTVADQVNYALDAKFLKLYLKDSNNRYFVRYKEATSGSYSFITFKDYEEIIYANTYQLVADATQEGVDVPSHFSIRDKQSLYAQITGTVTTAGDTSGGQCTLTDSAGLFTTTDYVSAGDTIHNTTDESDGIVLSVTSATELVCALFGGTDQEWDTNDNYVIQPQGRFELILDPPPDDASDTVRVEYVERPEPVYSDYGHYRFRDTGMEAVIKYAAWLYKYRDSEPDFGDRWYKWWDHQVRQEAHNLNPMLRKRTFGVNLKKRR